MVFAFQFKHRSIFKFLGDETRREGVLPAMLKDRKVSDESSDTLQRMLLERVSRISGATQASAAFAERWLIVIQTIPRIERVGSQQSATRGRVERVRQQRCQGKELQEIDVFDGRGVLQFRMSRAVDRSPSAGVEGNDL